ncbi:MAG: NIPSNAP family protein [Acidobacteriota bacterium]
MTRNIVTLGLIAAVFVAGFWVGKQSTAQADAKARVFELRTYVANEGKMDALHARFRHHTLKFFERHGMGNVGYWTPQDGPGAGNTLVYVLAHSSREEAKRSWQSFRDDPSWKKVKADSEVNGVLTSKVESVFLTPTDYSPLK